MSRTVDGVFDDDFLDKKIDNKYKQRVSVRQSAYYYISGSAPDKKGRMRSFLLGPYSDSVEANEVIRRKRLTSAVPVELSTADLGKASQILKARKLHGNSDIGDVFDRLKHKGVGLDDI